LVIGVLREIARRVGDGGLSAIGVINGCGSLAALEDYFCLLAFGVVFKGGGMAIGVGYTGLITI
jgi:hypothetical protein